MRSIHDALEIMLRAFTPRGSRRAPLGEALGSFTVEDLYARHDSPPFANSAMDGYAVRTADLADAGARAPVTLPVRGESRAGGPMPGALAAKSTARIFTGAPLPPGADAVVMQEEVAATGDRASFTAPARTHQHVRRAGEDLRAGALMLPRGARVGPGEIGLLASQHVGTVVVHRRPQVAILATGDELRDVSDLAEPGTLVDSNTHALAAQVREAGGVPWVLARAPDDVDVITERLREGLRADVLLSIGGVSVGSYDFVHEAFTRVGIETAFSKVRIKPGKPLTFGMGGDVPVVGIPGNPVSAMVSFEVFVRPGLRRMMGDPTPHPNAVHAALGTEVRRRPGRTELMRVTLEDDGARLLARPHARQGSGALPSFAQVDGLAILPADDDHLEEGTRVDVILLGNRRGSARSPFIGL